jgi:polar amino acid transport system substrate-binding protein
MDGTHGKHRGVLLEMAEALLQRAGLVSQTRFYPWARALLLASETPRTLILPLNRTPEREARFQWLLKLYAQRFVFLSLSPRPRGQRRAGTRPAGVLRGSSNLARLQQLGLPSSGSTRPPTSTTCTARWSAASVGARYGSELIHTEAWQRKGRAREQLQVGMTLESADIWLGAQAASPRRIARLRQQQDAMLADGMERLFRRYGIRLRADDLR